MADISSYPRKLPKVEDLVLFSETYDANAADPAVGNPTKSATVQDIIDLVPSTGGGGGSVTSVAATGFDGISVIGSPITSSGTLFLSLTDGGIPTAKLASNIITINGTSVSLGGSIDIAQGSVTSVGLSTDVAAFQVTNSPVTNTGTLGLNLSGGSVGQFLKQDGTWATLPEGLVIGTTSTTAKAGDIVTITTDQAAAIVANTAKVGITPTQASDITANNAKISFDTVSSTRLADTSGVNTGDQDLSVYLLNTTDTLTGDLTVTNEVAATTFLGDLNGTINTVTTASTKPNATNDTTVATTAFVKNLIGEIPAGLAFEGTWNADIDVPDLSIATPNNGQFWIVSVNGATNLSGITDWKVGDWAIWVEDGAGTNAWQKVDNSSVLDGQGTGQTVALWSGSGDSNTLTNAPITVSGNNVTITGTAAASNLSGTNTGDQDLSGYLPLTGGTLTGALSGTSGSFEGNVNVTGDVSNGGTINIGDTASYRGVITYSGASQTNLDIINSYTSATAAINFKLGTAGTPVTALKLLGSGTAIFGGALTATFNTYNDFLIKKQRTDNSQIFGIREFGSNGSMALVTNNIDRLSIDNNGKVGIGTTSPESKLDILAPFGGATKAVYIEQGEFNQIGLHIKNTNGASSTTGILQVDNSAGTSFIVNGSGNVGIGTTTPDTLLQATNISDGTDYISYEVGNSAINANNKGGFAIYELGVKQATLEYYRDGSGKFEIASQGASNHISLSTTAVGDTAPTERLRIASTGNVGIGPVFSNRALSVTGNLEITGNFYSKTGSLELGQGRTSNGVAYIDLTGQSGTGAGTDYGLRLIRNSGANASSDIIHIGTGNLNITAGTSVFSGTVSATSFSGSGSSITNVNAASVDGYSVWSGTQAAYNALTPDANTIYHITA